MSTLTGSAVPSGAEEMIGVCVGACLFVLAEVCKFKPAGTTGRHAIAICKRTC